MAQDSLYAAIVCISTFIFFLRIRAVYFADIGATSFFLLAWLGVAGSCIYLPFNIHATEALGMLTASGQSSFMLSAVASESPLARTASCQLTGMGVGCLSCFISAAIFDTIIFVALSWRVLCFCLPEDNWKSCFRHFIGQLQLPVISEAVLRGAQRYYV